MAAPFLDFDPSTLNEKLDVDMKELRQFSCLRFANGTLSVKYLGRDTFRPEDLP